MSEEKSVRRQLEEVYHMLGGEIKHGEAFYDGGRMLQFFFDNCDELKRLAQELYEENKKRAEEEGW